MRKPSEKENSNRFVWSIVAVGSDTKQKRYGSVIIGRGEVGSQPADDSLRSPFYPHSFLLRIP